MACPWACSSSLPAATTGDCCVRQDGWWSTCRKRRLNRLGDGEWCVLLAWQIYRFAAAHPKEEAVMTNLATGVIGAVLVAALLGFMLWWVKALPLIIIVAGVMVLLLVDFA